MKKFHAMFILCVFFLLTGCSKLMWWVKEYPSDNFVEEAIEDIIKDKTGLDVDLSPFSEEK